MVFANLNLEIITKLRKMKNSPNQKNEITQQRGHFNIAWPNVKSTLMLNIVIWLSSLILTTFGV